MKDKLLFDGEAYIAIHEMKKQDLIDACKGMEDNAALRDAIIVNNFNRVMDHPYKGKSYAKSIEYIDWAIGRLKLTDMGKYQLMLLKVRIVRGDFDQQQQYLTEAEKVCPKNERKSFLIFKLHILAQNKKLAEAKKVQAEIYALND